MLRASESSDAPEELAEVDAAYAVLHDPQQRASYNANLRDAEAEEDRKYAKLDAEMPRHRHRGSKHVSTFIV
jgi:DnaJ-class molecular chaperone